VTVAVSDVTSRLKTVTFPETTGGGAVYPQEGAQTATVSHAYAFTSGSTFSGSGAVTVSDRAGNVAGVPLTVTRDVASPTAVLTVAKRSSRVTLTVAWGGEDGTGAGVATYDVQVREDEGGWTDWLTGTGQTQGEYVGQYGHRYGFRVRATDRVSNTGDWVEGTSFLARVTKYYAFNGQRVAMREGDVVYYLHSDHLGSTSVASSDSGALHSRQGYTPYGEVRYVTGELPTEFGFTGQRNDSYIKLIQMGARWYDPSLGRFISADTIVPDFANPQSLNRYSYTRNNPLKFRDPSGHREIYGGFYEPYSDYWYTYVNPEAPGCQHNLEFIDQGASLAVDFTPVVGDVKGLIEVGTGKDLITGESLGAWRWLGLLGLSEVRHLRHGDEVFKLAGAARAMDKLADATDAMRRIPLGFKNADEFAEFGAHLNGGLKSAGYEGVQAIFQGSSVTGVQHKTRAAFDVGRVSDFDIALASPDLLQRAKELDIGLRGGGIRTGPLRRWDLEALGLLDLREELGRLAGRDVNFMIYESIEAAMGRSPSILAP